MKWAGHVACMGADRKVFKVLVGEPEGKRLLGRWEDRIKMDLTENGWEGVEWIHLAQYRDQWQALVNMVMNPLVQTPWSELVTRQYIFGINDNCV
jgi:hypothetical protein